MEQHRGGACRNNVELASLCVSPWECVTQWCWGSFTLCLTLGVWISTVLRELHSVPNHTRAGSVTTSGIWRWWEWEIISGASEILVQSDGGWGAPWRLIMQTSFLPSLEVQALYLHISEESVVICKVNEWLIVVIQAAQTIPNRKPLQERTEHHQSIKHWDRVAFKHTGTLSNETILDKQNSENSSSPSTAEISPHTWLVPWISVTLICAALVF